MPLNNQTTKSHKRIFDPIPEELDVILKLITFVPVILEQF
jgi:hypothetical protein